MVPLPDSSQPEPGKRIFFGEKFSRNGENVVCCYAILLGQQHIVEKIPVFWEKNLVYFERSVQVRFQGLPRGSTPPISDKK